MNDSSGFEEGNEKLSKSKEDARMLKNEYDSDAIRLKNMQDELKKIAKQHGLEEVCVHSENNNEAAVAWDSRLFLQANKDRLNSYICDEIYAKPNIFPELTLRDGAVVALAGLIAAVLDILVVKIPKDINYMGKYKQDGSDITGYFRKLGVNEDGKLNSFFSWMEEKNKVSFDKVSGVNIEGLNPRTHRLLTLGHDPILGLLFGTLDIYNGTLSAIDVHGNLEIIQASSLYEDTGIISAVITWIGHLISDVCTSMGLPVPGWGLLQFLQVGSFGEKQRNIAEISKWMYLNGYDIRHFLTMAIVPAAVELTVRVYWLLEKYHLNIDEKIETLTRAEQEMKAISQKLKLHKMLFFAHSIATGGNVLKVVMAEGNPLAINIAEWGALLKESIVMVKAMRRDLTGEMINRNRERINREWEEIQDIEIGRIKRSSQVIDIDLYR